MTRGPPCVSGVGVEEDAFTRSPASREARLPGGPHPEGRESTRVPRLRPMPHHPRASVPPVARADRDPQRERNGFSLEQVTHQTAKRSREEKGRSLPPRHALFRMSLPLHEAAKQTDVQTPVRPLSQSDENRLEMLQTVSPSPTLSATNTTFMSTKEAPTGTTQWYREPFLHQVLSVKLLIKIDWTQTAVP